MFFLKCRAARADDGSRAGRHPIGSGRSAGEPGLAPAAASPPSGGGGQALSPGIQPVGVDAQLLGDHLSGLAAGSQFLTASRLKVSSNLRRISDGWLFHGSVRFIVHPILRPYLYVWRINHAANDGEKERMANAADFAYRQALALCPHNPDAGKSYVDFLKSRNRNADAALVEAMAR